MARSLWKGPYFEYSFTKIEGFASMAPPSKPDKALSKGSLHSSELSSKRNQLKGIQKIWSRRSVILPQFVDRIFEIHNGKQFIKLQVGEEMIGHKFGEFALTRKKPRHVVPKKNKPTK